MFNFLLKLLSSYLTNEKNRIQVLKLLYDKMEEEYSEQTVYGNYNNFIVELVLAKKDDFKKYDRQDLKIIKLNLEAGISTVNKNLNIFN